MNAEHFLTSCGISEQKPIEGSLLQHPGLVVLTVQHPISLPDIATSTRAKAVNTVQYLVMSRFRYVP